MTRILALIALLVACGAAAAFFLRGEVRPSAANGEDTPTARRTKAADSTLYCEFYDFVGRRPKVGFTFVMMPGAVAPVFTQANQIERDGTRTEFGAEAPRPAWVFEASDSPATLTAPDGAITINIYAYDPARRDATWFEAGLRSVQYLNLDGKCRHGVG
ncbi:hypothetical protein G3T14_09205 [Methylobacterium sp. BTF04]|uniref:hypothetical protein n=1 Tax=Methylobacterium sp. BTF04 TaxID=2708300 RepID=UPI0013D06EAC|nr:hypothetical protein [Methylobacterium sp. BTF04]NEU12310.1 hypothetical protein [Methylobacterium sp. BTF04]